MSVVAYMFCAEQGHLRITAEEDGVNMSRVVQHANNHALVWHWGMSWPSPLSDRDGVFALVVQPLENGECIMSVESIEHDRAPRREGVVRLHARRLMRFKPLSPTTTRFTITTVFDLGGSIPRFISDSFTTPVAARAPLDALRYFNQVKAAKSFEAADAKELGQLLVLDTDNVRGKRDPDPLEAKLRTFVDRSAVLRGARSTCPWIEVLLKEVLRNRLRVPKGSMKALEEFTEEDARKAGRGFANALVANATAEAAVDEWVMTYPALSELEQRYPFVRPMMNAVASSILAQVAWGVKFRAYLGAGVSAADALSDAYMINEFYVMGKVSTANGLMAMVGANLGFQVLVVFIQTQGLKKDKWRTALVEMLSVVTFTKPGLDAYRVASGAEQLPGAAASPLMEMLYVKGGELFFEAIPGLVLQLVAVLLAKERSTSAYVSIWISTASTALTATTMFWDNDTDPGVRKRNPDAAGIVPDLDRGTAFAVIFVMCACQIVAKATATALLVVTNGSWLLGYIIADHALHFAYRASRRDVVAYLSLPPRASYVVAPIFRTVLKAIADFTGSPLLRVPLLCGGSYWLFNLAMSQASVFVCVHLYLKHAPGDGVEKVKSSTLWTGASCLSAAWLVTFLYFVFRVAVPRLRHTLWSWTSGRQAVHQYFLERESDEGKFGIFTNNLLLWESDIGEEVKAWTAENWARWSEEKPPWFKVEVVPDRFLPVGELQQLGTSKKSIQIQLSQFIEGVGQKDEVVMVAPSYFSNVIVKKNLGRQISDKEVAELQRAAASSAAAQKEESERVAKLLSEIGSICITRKRASGDKLFGSVTTKNISDALRERVAEEVLTSKAAKLSVVGVKGDIKTAGSYECELSLPQGVTAKFELVVAGSDEECAT
ncbi:hypothetical protein TeGR_g7143 [Tetraparma gracilis]|uniref:50S ribosomal protein L9, chloroplastic n=1 Tax=Tetraparma gracilis TaxID=2962635 RepID=A0ABQ6M4U7_9STRA|nr:hypothetical protein TeGR_g7143 [Tetraparma gracilis]